MSKTRDTNWPGLGGYSRTGFTLIELVIVIGIIAIIAIIGATSLSNSMRSKMKSLSWRVTTMTKYLYNSAITENKTNRLVLDFESNSYWAESTFDKFLLDKGSTKDDKFMGGEKKKEEKKPEEKPKEETAATDEKKEGTEEEVIYVEKAEASFAAVESIVIESKQVPQGLAIKDVWTEHDREPISGGKAYIYFFPSGVAERAIINFKDANDERQMSIKIDPFTGDVDIKPEYRRMEEVKK